MMCIKEKNYLFRMLSVGHGSVCNCINNFHILVYIHHLNQRTQCRAYFKHFITTHTHMASAGARAYNGGGSEVQGQSPQWGGVRD